MNHLLRSHYTKTISSSTINNNENDENATIRNLICKQISKVQQTSTIVQTNGSNKGTIRGILGEVGNMTLSNKPMISKPKLIQKQTAIATIIESKSIVSVPPPAPPPTATATKSIVIENEIEEIIIDDDSVLETDNDEFDCDSADLFNITTVSEFVVDICKYWRELEQKTPIVQNFLLHRREGF